MYFCLRTTTFVPDLTAVRAASCHFFVSSSPRSPPIKVEISGAVKGKAVWPKNEKPVAWHSNAEMVRMKLGLYHSINDVYDGEVEYRDISIEGPNGIIRTSSAGRVGAGDPDGSVLVGCFKDKKESRVMKAKYTSKTMTAEARSRYMALLRCFCDVRCGREPPLRPLNSICSPAL